MRHGGASAKSVVVIEAVPVGDAPPAAGTPWDWGYNDGPKVARAKVGADDFLRERGLVPITAQQGDAGWHTGRLLRCTSTMACRLEDVTTIVRGDSDPTEANVDAVSLETFFKAAKTFLLPVQARTQSVQEAWRVGHATEARALRGLGAFLRRHKAGSLRRLTKPGLLVLHQHPVLGGSLDGLAKVRLDASHPHAGWLTSKLVDDGLARDQYEWTAVEVKTAVAEAACEDAERRFPRGVSCVFVGMQADQAPPGSAFDLACMDRQHRAQLEHHAMLTGVAMAAYVRCTRTRIESVVIVGYAREYLSRLRACRVLQLRRVSEAVWTADAARAAAAVREKFPDGVDFAPDGDSAVQRVLLGRALHDRRAEQWQGHLQALREWDDAVMRLRREPQAQEEKKDATAAGRADSGRARKRRRTGAGKPPPRPVLWFKDVDAKPAEILRWNASKWPVDVFSQLAKSAAPLARMDTNSWLHARFWQYALLNLWRLHNLATKASELRRARTVSEWNSILSRCLPFRVFLMDLAYKIPALAETRHLVGPLPPGGDGAAAGSAADRDADEAPPPFPARKKREKWNGVGRLSDPALVRWRLSHRAKHVSKVSPQEWFGTRGERDRAVAVQKRKQRYCVVCCHTYSAAKQGFVDQHTSTAACVRCGFVALCLKPRQDRTRTCFDIWHSDRTLPGPALSE